MPYRLDHLDQPAGLLDTWSMPARHHFMASPAQATLTDELARYLRGEVSGRCFLVAGHRGIGKTSLLRRVVQDTERVVIDAAKQAADAGLAGVTAGARPPALQRPLLVKIHGPSLLEPLPAKQAATAEPGLTEPEARAAGTLAQITIALYRALAADIATCFRRHARWVAERADPTAGASTPGLAYTVPLPTELLRSVGELAEAAAQLSLDLDDSPDAALLRQRWDAARRIGAGVLWPATIGAWLEARDGADQGLREIVAVVTANQAFQVCTGTVTDSETRDEAAKSAAQIEAKGEIGRDALRALFGLGAGVLVGASASAAGADGATAFAGGGAAALLTAGSIGWSATRSRNSDRARKYSFLKDRTPQSLDRDLPMVIRRLRDAGLAPVFAVDELDKLAKPAEEICRIIARLKHLTTDDGLFCFLADRDSFEALRRPVNGLAFPVEHTLFSRRLLVLYGPADMARYLRLVLRPDGPTTPTPEERRRLTTLARAVMARSRLNTIDMERALEPFLAGTQVVLPGADGRRDLRAELHALVQIAVDHVLLREDRMRRFTADPIYAQLLLDTLYMPHRLWQDGAATVSADRAGLLAHLLNRMGVAAEADPETAFAARYPDCDPAALVAALAELLLLLAAPDGLAWRATPTETSPPSLGADDPLQALRAEDFDLLGALEAPVEGEASHAGGRLALLAPEPGQRPRYRFLYDVFGQRREVSDTPPPGGTVATHGAAEITLSPLTVTATGVVGDQPAEPDLVSAWRALRELAVQPIMLTLDDLSATGVLPLSTDPRLLEAAAQRLEAGVPLAEDAVLVGELLARVERRLAGIATVLLLAARVAADAGVAMRQALDALLRYAPVAEAAQRRTFLEAFGVLQPRVFPVPQDAADAREYLAVRIDALAGPSADGKLPAALPRLGDALRSLCGAGRLAEAPWGTVPAEVDWLRWRQAFITGAGMARLPPPVPSYGDIVRAAEDKAPGSVFRADWAAMTPGDWAWLCALAFPAPDAEVAEAPEWALLVGLAALGFDRAALTLAQARSPSDSAFQGVIQAAPINGEKGILILTRGGPDSLGEQPALSAPPPVPIFPIRWAQRDRYVGVGAWLRAHELVGEQIYDERQPS